MYWSMTYSVFLGVKGHGKKLWKPNISLMVQDSEFVSREDQYKVTYGQ